MNPRIPIEEAQWTAVKTMREYDRQHPKVRALMANWNCDPFSALKMLDIFDWDLEEIERALAVRRAELESQL